MDLTESYDLETSDGFETDCDFVVRPIKRRFVKGVMAHGGGPQLDRACGHSIGCLLDTTLHCASAYLC